MANCHLRISFSMFCCRLITEKVNNEICTDPTIDDTHTQEEAKKGTNEEEENHINIFFFLAFGVERKL